MKRIVIIILILGFLVSFISLSEAADRKRRVREPGSKIISSAKEDAPTKAKQALRAKEWIVYLAPASDKKAKPQLDILSFSDNKFSSKNFTTKGYKEVDYSLIVKEDGSASWQALQQEDSLGTVFWYGEYKDNNLQGIMSLLEKNGTLDDFYFTSALPQEALTEQK